MEERRKHSRAAVNQRVWICNFDEDLSPDSRKDCVIVDISEGGACIQCSARYQEGQPIAFTYQDFIADGARPVLGVVMWGMPYSGADYRYGIKFLGLSTQMRCRIQELVSSADEKKSAPEEGAAGR